MFTHPLSQKIWQNKIWLENFGFSFQKHIERSDIAWEGRAALVVTQAIFLTLLIEDLDEKCVKSFHTSVGVAVESTIKKRILKTALLESPVITEVRVPDARKSQHT